MPKFEPKAFIDSLPTQPGIYQFFDAKGNTLYVGKARNLKKRVTSYFQKALVDTKTVAMIEQVANATVTITGSENEALLLESNLIKKLRPRYNILLKDDKSYPYIFLSGHQDFPRMDIHRGAKNIPGRYFGPFPSAGSVRETLALCQKIFKIRQCTDHFFSLRTRPCLQYFIERCTAPCVAYIDAEAYQRNVHLASLFLEGKNNQVIEELASKMEESSLNMKYEEAAHYRDQIASVRRVQERQHITSEGGGDADAIAAISRMGQICIQVIYIRGGRLIGGKAYFPTMPADTSKEEALASFLPQYYLDPARGEVVPQQILINLALEDQAWIAAALSEQLNEKINIYNNLRGIKKKWLEIAFANAQHALASHIAGKITYYQRFETLQAELKLPNLPQRIECFDVSHTMGEATVASCVVFNLDGASKKDYRKFNIKDVVQGDDYAALNQALTRRYTKLKELENALPDILMIDGGKGQLAQAEKVLEELQVSGVILIGIAKGEGRKPGLETLFISGRDEPVHLNADSPALHLLQQVRDEAHRFAIVGHRKQRAKARVTSPLENIPGIGAKRRRELLRQFGGLQELKRASIEDIAKVPGINRELAQKVFEFLQKK